MKISVITASFNNVATIEATIRSVQMQSHSPVEHIIIDGGSNDGTLEVIEGYRGNLAMVVSEMDHGIYDAMNKGIALASGDVIGLLNADDFYAGEQVLARVAAVFADPEVEACYGDLEYVAADNTDHVFRYWKSGPYRAKRFYNGWMPPHPTFFVRRSVYERLGGFNTTLGSSADYELMLRFLLKGGVHAAYIPEVLVKMRTGGTSNATLANRVRANLNDRLAWRVNGLRPHPWTLYFKPLSKLGQFFRRRR